MHNLFNNRIEYFLKCAQMSSFSAAAFKIGVTQSTLSAAIKKLEEDMGALLFHRSVEGVRLTRQGEVLFKKLQYYQKQMGVDVLGGMQEAEQVSVKVGAVFHYGVNEVLPFIEKFRKLIPKPQIYMTFSLHSFQAVEAGELDFAFVAWTSQPKGVKFIAIKDDPFAIVGLKKKFGHIEKLKTMKELNALPWVHLPKPQYDWTKFIEINQEGYVARDGHALRSIILGGHAIGDVQLGTFTESELKTLAHAGVKSSWPDTKIYAVYRSDISANAKALLDFMVEKMKP